MWILLTQTRKRCLWTWMILSGLITVLTLLQTITGELSGAATTAWTWILLNLYPGVAFLFLGVLRNRYPSKAIPRNLHLALWWCTFVYLLLALATILAEPLVIRPGRSTQQFLLDSYQWLLPPNVLLLGGYYQAFIRRTPLFMPNESSILSLAAQEAGAWRKKGDLLRSRCFDEIAAGNVAAVFSILREQHSKNTQLQDNLLVLEGEYNTVIQNRTMNITEPEEAQRQINRITLGVLNLIRQP